MLKDLKYDNAAFRLPNGDYDKIKLEDLLSIKYETYVREYKGNLYCPECHKSQLALVKKQFLYTYKNQKHSNKCSYGLELFNDTAFMKCMKTASVESVKLRLQWLIDSQLTEQHNEIHPLVVNMKGNDCILSGVRRKDVNRTVTDLKRIPIKSLTTPFGEDDYNVFKLFYGKVSITTIKNQWEDGSCTYYIHLYHATKKQLISTLNFNQNLIKNHTYPFLKYHETVVNIAFAAKMSITPNKNSDYQNLFFINGKLIQPYFLLINLL